MTTPIPDPGLIACHIDESAGMDPTVPGNGPTTPCDVCGVAFGPGDLWNYHARLGVYVHSKCAADFPVRGEDISTHTVLWGQIPDAPEAARPAAPTVPATPPVGVETSEGSTGPQTGAGEVGLGDAIRAIIPATYTDDGYFGVTALEIGEFADRADALERGGRELGRQIQRYLTWVLDATGMHHLIDEDGDGDWELVWERLAEMGRAYATSPSEIEQVAEQCDQMISIQGYDAVRCERDTGHSGMHWSNGELSVTTPKAIQ